jgi:HK97 gp10 family phage protein
MADITVTVTGFNELGSALDESDQALNDGVNEALQELANDIEDRTTALCPVDTGALRDSIDVQVSGDTLTAVAGEDYATFVDEGTRFMDAQPFFEDPIDELVDQFRGDLEQKLGTSLQNAFGR